MSSQGIEGFVMSPETALYIIVPVGFVFLVITIVLLVLLTALILCNRSRRRVDRDQQELMKEEKDKRRLLTENNSPLVTPTQSMEPFHVYDEQAAAAVAAQRSRGSKTEAQRRQHYEETGSGTHKLDAMVLGPVVHAALVKNRGASKHAGEVKPKPSPSGSPAVKRHPQQSSPMMGRNRVRVLPEQPSPKHSPAMSRPPQRSPVPGHGRNRVGPEQPQHRHSPAMSSASRPYQQRHSPALGRNLNRVEPAAATTSTTEQQHMHTHAAQPRPRHQPSPLLVHRLHHHSPAPQRKETEPQQQSPALRHGDLKHHDPNKGAINLAYLTTKKQHQPSPKVPRPEKPAAPHQPEVKLTAQVLYDELYGISDKWYKLGVQVRLPISRLSFIDRSCINNEEAMKRLCEEWLRYDFNPSWEKLVTALEHRVVGESLLAASIRACHCQPTTNEDEFEEEHVVTTI